MELLIFSSLPVLAMIILIGLPVILRRMDYPKTQTVFGTISGLVVGLGVWTILSSLRHHGPWEALPLEWLAPVIALAGLIYFARTKTSP